jgi:hypothetical protein
MSSSTIFFAPRSIPPIKLPSYFRIATVDKVTHFSRRIKNLTHDVSWSFLKFLAWSQPDRNCLDFLSRGVLKKTLISITNFSQKTFNLSPN